MGPDGNAIQDGDPGTDPAVATDHDTLPPDALVTDQRLRVMVVVVLGVATEILSNDTIVADVEPAGAPQVGVFTDADVVANPDVGTGIIQGCTHHQLAPVAYAHVIPEDDPGDTQCFEGYTATELQKAAVT